jgi:preprotein translocase subunit SecE
MAEQKEKVKIGQRVGKFFKEIRMEMKKVIWPTRQQLVNNTLIVFAACLLVGAVVWIADAGLGVLFTLVFGQS